MKAYEQQDLRTIFDYDTEKNGSQNATLTVRNFVQIYETCTKSDVRI